MTRRLRKDAPAGATHFAFISGKIKYVKIEKSGCQFIYAGEWIPSVLLDERFNLHALEVDKSFEFGVAGLFAFAVIMLVLTYRFQ